MPARARAFADIELPVFSGPGVAADNQAPLLLFAGRRDRGPERLVRTPVRELVGECEVRS